jgi:hypothetical protein
MFLKVRDKVRKTYRVFMPVSSPHPVLAFAKTSLSLLKDSRQGEVLLVEGEGQQGEVSYQTL